MSNIQTEQVIFRNICVYVYTYIHVTIISRKGTMNLKESKKELLGGPAGRKEKRNKIIRCTAVCGCVMNNK